MIFDIETRLLSGSSPEVNRKTELHAVIEPENDRGLTIMGNDASIKPLLTNAVNDG